MTTSSQSRPGSNGNKELLRIPQSSSITEASPSDSLMSYPRHSFGEFYTSAEMESVYCIVSADWVTEIWRFGFVYLVAHFTFVYNYVYLVPGHWPSG